ncbi:MAG TPA: bifunctional shikimate kinase/3-dehydroquinate synthase [Candidatus Limnocylindrales bacterium]|nr:bifunctional shikimate kinase/3-dehydroquinate synthase [Candidatus Limnocylindrales bacterium]
MDVVLVGLPGSGKSAVGRRLAHRHDAPFVDLDDQIERASGRSIPEIFAEDGEPVFRRLEREAVAALGPADPDPQVRRVIATGGGAVVDPRNRWALYRRRLPIWLDGRPEVLAQRLRRSPHVRPLVAGRDPIGAIRGLAHERERFYAPGHRLNSASEVSTLVERIDEIAAARRGLGGAAGGGAGGGGGGADRGGTVLLRAETAIGRIVVGEGVAAAEVAAALRAVDARRAILVSEPGAWAAAGEGLAVALGAVGWTVERVMLPEGEDAKRLAVIEAAASELARLRAERREPLVAVGGGALGDAAGFLAATWLRGVPVIHVPTTLVAQIDSSIGGKTGVDLSEGKNLVGAFHQPLVVVIDVAFLRSLPDRQRRAALGEAVKMAALGDERLFALLEVEGEAIAAGDDAAFERGAIAEAVERAAWAKVEVVTADEREQGATGGRITLNLGHSVGHAVEAAGGFGELLHGEAVAVGLRAAARIGVELGVTPPALAARIERLLTRLGLATEPVAYRLETVMAHLATDKKHAGGSLRWVLPGPSGPEVRSDVPDELVERVVGGLLAPAGAPSGSGSGRP